jgi:hypothetical protein
MSEDHECGENKVVAGAVRIRKFEKLTRMSLTKEIEEIVPSA